MIQSQACFWLCVQGAESTHCVPNNSASFSPLSPPARELSSVLWGRGPRMGASWGYRPLVVQVDFGQQVLIMFWKAGKGQVIKG